MRVVSKFMLTSLFCVSLAHCKKSDPPPAPTPAKGSAVATAPTPVPPATGSAGSASGSATGNGSATEPPQAATAMAKKSGNCPSLVDGAVTTSSLKDGQLSLLIASTNKDAVASIQKRTKELLEGRAAAKPGAAHDQNGAQGGAAGICPVIATMDAKATNNDAGVSIAFAPKANVRMDMAATKADIDERIKKSIAFMAAKPKPEPGLGHGAGVGGGTGDDGSNHSGQGDGKGKQRDGAAAGTAAGSAAPHQGHGDGKGGGDGGGKGNGGGDGKGKGGGDGKGDKPAAKSTK